MIRVVNLRDYNPRKNEVLIKVDRSNKILGNKFVMNGESERDAVCDKYDTWFNKQVESKNQVVLGELRKIYKIALNSDVALGCWCYPKRCHAYTIKKFIDSFLPKPVVENAEDKLIIVPGDILKIKEGTIIHQVNNCGKMGAGLAKEIRRAYPSHYNDYMQKYTTAFKLSDGSSEKVDSLLGDFVETSIGSLKVRGIFSQDGYGRDKCYTSIELFKKCLLDISKSSTEAVYIPYGIGCGLAGGDWDEISKIIYEILPSAIIIKKD